MARAPHRDHGPLVDKPRVAYLSRGRDAQATTSMKSLSDWTVMGRMSTHTKRAASAAPPRGHLSTDVLPNRERDEPIALPETQALWTIREPRHARLAANIAEPFILHAGSHLGGWTAKQIHHAVLATFHLSEQTYGLNQLRYDLRKLKGHGLIERDGSRYAYRLTPKGIQVALLFLFFHKRLCGPLANSRFHHEPDPKHRPQSQLEAAYHRADKAIQQIVELLAAA